MGRLDWASDGACRDVDPESLFVIGAAQHEAKMICRQCSVRLECLADALDSRTEFGVWGGMTERERRTLLRRRPDVASWRQFFSSAQEAEEYAAVPPLRLRRRHSVRSGDNRTRSAEAG
ncbi:WhiB family transcriptional regulator [Jatrophihabitans telluris]|uniref:Transcriptional regulator WhiB n=1 Tax=Jatrophihabitans telluris TaxID=2038343 RepID=A0ABY4R3B7_9ACTN|nr:WhiB family transcriptional regulator [Jatrophihabitans telluris]